MNVQICGEPKEIAALVVALQERQKEDYLLLAVDKNETKMLEQMTQYGIKIDDVYPLGAVVGFRDNPNDAGIDQEWELINQREEDGLWKRIK